MAVALARAGEREQPPVPSPRALRPVLAFVRLPPRALETARRVLEEDEGFRERVAAHSTEEDLGRASWLFLARPQGWEEELATLTSAVEEADTAAREEHAERSARRRLEHAQAAVRRAEERLAAGRAAALRAEQELEAANRARRAAEAEARTLRRRIGSLEHERDAARRRAEEAEAGAENSHREVERLQKEVERLAGEVSRRVTEPAPPASESARGEPARVAPAPAEPAPGEPGSGDLPTTRTNLDVVARALLEAARAGERLGSALQVAARGLGAAQTAASGTQPRHFDAGHFDARHDDAAHNETGHNETGHNETGPSGPEARGRGGEEVHRVSRSLAAPGAPVERVAVTLPPAIFEDSVEAAEHLVRTRGVVLLVDGYNASLWAWPELPIADQRRRLVDALNELAARAATSVEVVFDGAERSSVLPLDGRGRVRVRFSPAEMEADDLILALIDDTPASQPVLVATNDRRVQGEARRRGANVIGVGQLFGVLRRER